MKHNLHFYLSDPGNVYNSLITIEINHAKYSLTKKDEGEQFSASRQKSTSSAQETRTLLIEANGNKSYLYVDRCCLCL